MKKIYCLPYNQKIIEISNQAYKELEDFLKFKNPKAKSLEDDQELVELHKMLILIRSKQVRAIHLMAEAQEVIVLEVFESKEKPSNKRKNTKSTKGKPKANLRID